jgi:hypothetical protein
LIEFKKEIEEKFVKSSMNKTFVFPRRESINYDGTKLTNISGEASSILTTVSG